MQRKAILGGLGSLLGIGASLAAYSILREPINIKLDHLKVKLRHTKGRLPADGLRILHISDTHFQGLKWREQSKINRIRKLTKGLEYDLLVHTGDFWHNDAGLANLLVLLDVLPKPKLGAFGVMGNHDYACYSHADALSRNWSKYQSIVQPIHAQGLHRNGTHPLSHSRNGADQSASSHYVNGSNKQHATSHRNVALSESAGVASATKPIKAHEYPLHVYRFMRYVLNMPFELEKVYYNDTPGLVKTLTSRGVTILDNQSVHLCQEIEPGRSVDLFLAGVDDVSEGKPNLESAYRDIPAGAPVLLLSHNPDILEEPDSRRADVILSGHTHGGQIRLPIIGAAHTHSAHLSRREAAGYMMRDDTHVYISRGVGEGIPLRFRAEPQITLVTVQS